jgi:hypothetical protein
VSGFCLQTSITWGSRCRELLNSEISTIRLIHPTSVTIPDHRVKAVFRGQPVQILLLVDCRIFPSRARCCGACALERFEELSTEIMQLLQAQIMPWMNSTLG